MCTTLKPLEIYRAISQCEEHSSLTLERGLLRIESSENRTSYGILPEIHFFLARSWFSLHQSVTEEYNKALETFHQQIQSLNSTVQAQKQQKPQQCATPAVEADGSDKSTVDIQTSSLPSLSSPSSLPGEQLFSVSGLQSVTQTIAWPNPSMIRNPLFIPVGLMPPQPPPQPVPTIALPGDPSLMYSGSLNSTGTPYGPVPGQPLQPHPASMSVYPSVFYYAQPGLGFSQTPVYSHYRPSQPPPPQPALLPTPGQSNPLVYAQSAGFTQIPCLQVISRVQTHHSSSYSLFVGPIEFALVNLGSKSEFSKHAFFV